MVKVYSNFMPGPPYGQENRHLLGECSHQGILCDLQRSALDPFRTGILGKSVRKNSGVISYPRRRFDKQIGFASPIAAPGARTGQAPGALTSSVGPPDLAPTPFGHRRTRVDGRPGLGVDDREARPPFEIADQRG